MKIIECPRDAMQGMELFIPTEDKIRYLNQLMKVGFDTIDAGSFVSTKAIPQLRDTAEVLERVEVGKSTTKLLAIVANRRGAEVAALHPAVSYLGFPLSISETFQQKNTNMSIPAALETVNSIQEICARSGKTLVTYISMGFGNPFNDPYDLEIVGKFVDILSSLDVSIISLADTIGISQPEQIRYLFTHLTRDFPSIEFGAHLHSHASSATTKIEAAFLSGCQRFDGAIHGWGGCPMAEDELVGNLATESIVSFLEAHSVDAGLDKHEFLASLKLAEEIFPN